MHQRHWPLFGVEVRTERITLRYADDALATQLIELASQGIHDPGKMPFEIPWTDLESPEFERQALQFHWRSRAEMCPESWRIIFGVLVDGQPVGQTDLAAEGFATDRRFTTGSWLGREFQGRGFGKELRVATLAFGFSVLHAKIACTAAWHDNPASLGVTRSLGYQATGEQTALRRGEPDRQLTFEMSRDYFDRHVHRDDIEIAGADEVPSFLGL